MSDQVDIYGNAQPLTWDGEPLYCPETVRKGLFDRNAFEQMPGQMPFEELPAELFASGDPIDGLDIWEAEGGAL